MQCNNCGYILAANAPNCPRCGSLTPYNVNSSPSNVYYPPTNYGQPVYGPPPQQMPYGPPSQVPPPYGQPVMVPVAMPAQRRSGCSTAVIIILVVILICIGGAFLANGGFVGKNSASATATSMAYDEDVSASATASQATFTTSLTPTPYPPYTESNPPSGMNFSGTAQQIITSAQMASAYNSSTYEPTELQSTFRAGEKMYLAFHWQNAGYAGYVAVIWYLNGRSSNLVHTNWLGSNYSYYNGIFPNAMSSQGQGAVEVYWCEKPDCQKRWLAWVRPFSVVA